MEKIIKINIKNLGEMVGTQGWVLNQNWEFKIGESVGKQICLWLKNENKTEHIATMKKDIEDMLDWEHRDFENLICGYHKNFNKKKFMNIEFTDAGWMAMSEIIYKGLLIFEEIINEENNNKQDFIVKIEKK